MKKIICGFAILIGAFNVSAQPNSYNSPAATSFVAYQMGFQRPREAFARTESNLKALFAAKNLNWPARYMYIRSFKYDSQLEVWVKNTINEPYKLLKIYKVCALAGSLGPKRFEGDYQVPEGFYHINEFNPNSSYRLSLGLNYPNASDRMLSDPVKPGGDIFIHGGCATVGCIPIKDNQIEELYVLTASAKSGGLDFIPVHIFPINYNVKRSYEYLAKLTKDDARLKSFTDRLEQAFDYFEKYKQIPIVMVRDNGEYTINDALPKVLKFQPKLRPKSNHKPIVRQIDFVADAVAKWPEFPGGMDAYEAYLSQLGKDLVKELPDEVMRAYVQVEFIVDTDGAPVNFKVLKGVDDYLNSKVVENMEQMPKWTPAIYHEKPVAKKMVQTVTIGN
ncbi:hypothetical protein GCM10027051_26120 [Niabella terrae]